jgi:hypothetical protein
MLRQRRDRILACVAIVAGASALAVLASRLETVSLEVAVDHAPITAAVGIGPAVFVTFLVAGTFALAHAVGYKRRALWITTTLLFAYLGLKGIVWQRAYRLAAAAQEPIIVDADGAAPPPPPGVDSLLILTTTVGLLCVVRAFGEMRRAVLVPVRVRRSSHEKKGDGEVDTESGAEPEPEGALEEAAAERGFGTLDQEVKTPVTREVLPEELDAAFTRPDPPLLRLVAPPPPREREEDSAEAARVDEPRGEEPGAEPPAAEPPPPPPPPEAPRPVARRRKGPVFE